MWKILRDGIKGKYWKARCRVCGMTLKSQNVGSLHDVMTIHDSVHDGSGTVVA
jgi:hypothetical protein|tara:strand:+ start:1165 stop:1323 length:159 start_codon:yes stop_codon:yes gene_type:complete